MAEQVGKFLTELPELETPTDGDLMYIVDAEASANSASKKITMSNLKRVLGGNVTGTVEGASVSFSDGTDGIPMEECEVTISPTQDLHGYSKPWAGGAGKNKLDCSNATSGSLYGVNFTVNKNTDGAVNSIDASNTATSSLYYEIFSGSLTFDSDVILSGCPSGGSLQKYGLLYNNGIGAEYGTGTTIPAGTTITSIGIRIGNGYTANNVTFKPMIRLATVQDDTFEPYSNICPISGHTDVTITVASTSGGSGDDTTVSLGRTVYKGTLNILTGELLVDGVLFEPASVSYYGLYGADNAPLFYYDTNTPIKPYLDTTSPEEDELSSNMYKACQQSTYFNMKNGECRTNAAVGASNRIYFRDDRFTDATSYNNQLAQNPLQLLANLYTPQTFNLTKAQVKTLLGQNYVSHDGGGNIKVVYIRDLDITINDLIDRVTALENE